MMAKYFSLQTYGCLSVEDRRSKHCHNFTFKIKLELDRALPFDNCNNNLKTCLPIDKRKKSLTFFFLCLWEDLVLFQRKDESSDKSLKCMQ